MLKLTKTGLGLLTRQYRSVLKKCWMINVGIFALGAVVTANEAEAASGPCESYGGVYTDGYFDSARTVDCYWAEKPSGITTSLECTSYGCGYYAYSGNVPNNGPYSPGDAGYGSHINWAMVYPTLSEEEKAVRLRYDAKFAMLSTNGKYVRKAGTVAENLQALDSALGKNSTYDFSTKSVADTLADELKYIKINSTGTAATASGTNSIAIGSSANAEGKRSIALGQYATAGSAEAIALGYWAMATGDQSTALGDWAYGVGKRSIVLGYGAMATGDSSTALGNRARANGVNSIALGSYSRADEMGVVSVGRTPVPDDKISQIWTQTSASGIDSLLSSFGYTTENAEEIYNDIQTGTLTNDEIIKKYKLDGYSKIVNVADGVDAHDAATVGQVKTTLNNYYTKYGLGGKISAANDNMPTSRASVRVFARGVAPQFVSDNINHKQDSIMNNTANTLNATADKVPTAQPSGGTKAHNFTFVTDDFCKTNRLLKANNDNFAFVTIFKQAI